MRVSREDFLRQLEMASAGLSQKDIIEQSSCFVFRSDGEVITFNDEVACVGKTCVKKVEGAVAGHPLLAVLHKMQDKQIDVAIEDGELILKGKRKRAGIRMEETVLLPVEGIEKPEKWKKLPEDFTEAIGIVKGCASNDESNFRLTCIHIHPEWIEACDDFQICRYPIETGIKESTLVRQTALKNVVGLDMTEFSETESWIHFLNTTGTVLSCRRYLEVYPDITEVINKRGIKTVLPGGLAEAVNIAEIFSAENADANWVKVELRSDRMKLEGRGPSGWYAEQQKVKYAGKPMSFTSIPKLLIEISKRVNECEISEGRLRVDCGKFIYLTCTGEVEDK